jgi:gamma-glutamyltranspeptidase / glutathione hydrolase
VTLRSVWDISHLFVPEERRPFPVFPALAQVGAPLYARHGIVASDSVLASEVGVQIMQRGGNAVDAAVAVALALAVTFPSAGNIGGGGFMVIRTANAKAVTIDYREATAAKAHRDMYPDKDRNLIPEASAVGYRAAGVPGTIMRLT